MAEKRFSREKHRPSPSSCVIYKTQRPTSTDNEAQQEPIIQPFVRRDHYLSMRTPARQSRVAKLIRQFQECDSTDTNVLSTSKTLPALKPRQTCISTTSDQTFPMKVKQTKLTTTNCPVHEISSLVELRIETSVHVASESVFNEFDNQTIDNTILQNEHSLDSYDSMSPSTQYSSLPSDELFRSQSTDRIHRSSSELNTSITSDDESSETSSVSTLEDFNIQQKTISVRRFEEVHATERTYIDKLRILVYVLPAQIKQTCEKDRNLSRRFKAIYKPLQITLKRLYKFHAGVVLPHIEQYKTGHGTNNIWTIIESYYETIEKLYKSYYLAYDENQDRLGKLCNNSPLITKAIGQCQVHMRSIDPITELNCANQRLLRYILLMESDMKYLDKDSPEYKHICSIHNELTQIARRCEDQLTVSKVQLKKLKAQFDNRPECFEHQQLIWHGSLKRRSPRRRIGIAQSYVLLFSECILVCEASGDKLELKRQLSIKNLTVDVIEGEQAVLTTWNSTYEQQWNAKLYAFRVNAIEKSYEFLVNSENNREKWISKMRQTNEEFRRQSTNVAVRQPSTQAAEPEFGTRAPLWVNDTDVTRCQICHNRFGSALIRSRHHCRSCGRCICGTCSRKKLILKYCNQQGEVRVCDSCYTHFTGIIKSPLPSNRILRNSDKTILFGDFYCVSSHSTIWFDLQEDHCLHVYGARLDQVEDWSIHLPDLRDVSLNKETRTFTLNTKDRIYKFIIQLNHQISFQENDDINEDLKRTTTKLLFYANLWYDTMQFARSKTMPLWYTQKRHSADSGIVVP